MGALALATLTLALLALGAAAPTAHVPVRRRAVDILSPLESGTVPYYRVQPLIYCSNVTRVALPAATAPACCTFSALECAKRCSVLRDCSAFRYAFYSDTPPAALDAPAGALPPGATWQACELFTWVDPASCSSQLELYLGGETATVYNVFNSPPVFTWEYRPRTGAIFYDTYWRSIVPAQSGSWMPLNISVSGPDVSTLLVNRTKQTAFTVALTEAAQVVCCPTRTTPLTIVQSATSAVGQLQPAALVLLHVQAIFGRDSNAYLGSHIADVLASADGEAALLSALLAGGFASSTALSIISAGGTQAPAPVCLPPQMTAPTSDGCYAAAVVVGIAVGLGGALLAVLAAAAVLLRRYELPARRRTVGARQGHDVFMSYRRADLTITDAVHDKLVLAGLRVFYDRGGDLAGKPFATAIFAAIRDAPVVCVVVTLDMVRAWAAHDASKVDYVLAELLLAFHFVRRGSVRLLYPLLVGEWTTTAAAAGGGERDYLPANPTFRQLRDSIPAVAPSATLALVASLLAAGGQTTLDADLAAATVRDLILGDEQLTGVLELTGCALSGPEEQAGLVLRHRYAERIVVALAAPQQQSRTS